ncbi:MAG TPA: hypothetical protein PLL20_14850 [Phycisphaerae bacterium]|nr:hypothetical protein [Phycisphaerae bacterium]HRR84339.1 hypothetical protein [Phycisphaerae bacterium]
MTPVTKIFVVLVCLFAFIFTPLTIGFVAQSYHWKALATQYQENMSTMVATERAALASAASAVSHYQAQRENDRLQMQSLSNDISRLEQRIEQLINEKEACDASRASWESSAQTLSAQLKVINNHNQALIEENSRLTKSEQDLRARNLSLQDRVEELSANSVTLAQQLRQKIEELTAVRQENDELRQSLQLGKAREALTSAAQPPAKAGIPTKVSEIRGSVTEVRLNEGLASIDVGSTAGVAEGMVMAVVRDGDYICDLIITDKVDPTQSVGKIAVQGSKQIRPGDTVIDERSLMAR